MDDKAHVIRAYEYFGNKILNHQGKFDPLVWLRELPSADFNRLDFFNEDTQGDGDAVIAMISLYVCHRLKIKYTDDDIVAYRDLFSTMVALMKLEKTGFLKAQLLTYSVDRTPIDCCDLDIALEHELSKEHILKHLWDSKKR